MSKVCDISKEKYWLAKMSEKYEYFYTKDFLFLLNFEKKKNLRFTSQRVFKISTLCHIFTKFNSESCSQYLK